MIMEKNMILIVDDAEINRKILKVIFEEQYQILEAADGEEAMALLDTNKDQIAVMFLDLIMPNKSGLDVLDYMKAKKYIKYIPVIMITGEATAESDEKAYEYGVSDIIYKPFAPKVVMRRTKNIIELFEYRANLESQLEERTKELIESNRKIKRNNEFLIGALSSVVEFRSLESMEHIRRIKCFTRIMLEHLNQFSSNYHFSEEQMNLIVDASALHDIGKIAIPDSIMLKKDKLTKEEEKELEKHTIYGCDLLENFKQEDDDEFYRYCYEICRYHHERDDGKGYPDGLKGEEIPIWAQVVSQVDCFDSLVSGQVYKVPFAVDEAMRVIREGRYGVFSKEMLDCMEVAKSELFHAAEVELSYAD